MVSAAELLRSLALVLSVWVALGLVASGGGGSLSSRGAAATFLALAVALASLRSPPERCFRPRGLALSFAAALCAQPLIAGAVLALGEVLGMARPEPLWLRTADPWLWLATGGLAPLFEELLYRRHLLPALRCCVGAASALGLSSAAFAFPHAEGWGQLGAFVAGLLLGAVRLASGSTAPCIAIHAGLNVSALGIPWLLCGVTVA